MQKLNFTYMWKQTPFNSRRERMKDKWIPYYRSISSKPILLISQSLRSWSQRLKMISLHLGLCSVIRKYGYILYTCSCCWKWRTGRHAVFDIIEKLLAMKDDRLLVSNGIRMCYCFAKTMSLLSIERETQK